MSSFGQKPRTAFCCASSVRPSHHQAWWGHQYDVPALGPTKMQAGTGEDPGWTISGTKSVFIFPNFYIAAMLREVRLTLRLEMRSINLKAPKSIWRLWDCLGKSLCYRGHSSSSLTKDVKKMGDLQPLEQKSCSEGPEAARRHVPRWRNSSSFFGELSSVVIIKCYSRNREKRERTGDLCHQPHKHVKPPLRPPRPLGSRGVSGHSSMAPTDAQ